MPSREDISALVDDLISKVGGQKVFEGSFDLRRSKPDIATQVECLIKAKKNLDIHHDFKIGDVVVWKDLLQNLKPYGPFIIIEILDEPVRCEDNEFFAYFNEKYNAIALFIDSQGDAVRSPLNLSRMEPYKAETES
jgi:hypothetical protein